MLVSIIVPIYNVEKYLEECLDSIIHQTHKDLDIILIDDGSTDNSLQIALKYAKKDRRILLISKPNNGQSCAKNLGLELLKGTQLREILEGSNLQSIESYTTPNSKDSATKEISKAQILSHFTQKDSNYFETNLENPHTLLTQKLPNTFVKFVDSDDYLALDHIEELLKYLPKDKENCLISHNFLEIENGKSTLKIFDHLNNYSDLKLPPTATLQQTLEFFSKIEHPLYFAWCGIFNAQLLNQYHLRHIPQIVNEDVGFGMMLFMLQGWHFHTEYNGYYYRIRDNSTTTQHNTNSGDIRKGVKEILHHFNSLKEARQYYQNYSLITIMVKVHSAMHSLPMESSPKAALQNLILKFIATIIARAISHPSTLSRQEIANFIPILKENNLYKPLKSYLTKTLFDVKFAWRQPRKYINIFTFLLWSK